jgi:hypothetical protein
LGFIALCFLLGQYPISFSKMADSGSVSLVTLGFGEDTYFF